MNDRAVVCRYVATTHDTSLVPRVIHQTDSDSLDFVTSHELQTHRRVTSSARYDKHDVIADLGGPAKPAIPTPLSVLNRHPQSWIDIGARWTVSHDPELVHEARLLAGQLSIYFNGDAEQYDMQIFDVRSK